jgi:hypothetical protein
MPDFDYANEGLFDYPKCDWRCTLSTLSWDVERGKEPCAFHRFMQRWLLGIKWERL